MPRSNSEESSAASLTSDEEDGAHRAPGPSLEPLTTTTAVRVTSRPESAVQIPTPSPEDSLSSPTSYNGLSPSERFRSSVKKVIQMNKASGGLGALLGQPGAEPGIDPRRQSHIAEYSHIHEPCEIEVVDFNTDRVTFRQFENDGFVRFMGKHGQKPSWAQVRWINVGGISWDVLSALFTSYGLHPLSIEDIIHARSTSRSKADYYPQHLFIHMLSHSLAEESASPLHPTWVEPLRSSSPERIRFDVEDKPSLLSGRGIRRRAGRRKSSLGDVERASVAPSYTSTLPRRWRDRAATLTAEGRTEAAKEAAVDELKKEERVQVLLRNMYIFLLPNGTVISIHQADRGFGDPIHARLRQGDTVLRTSADASLLVHALLDLVVDRAVQVADKYHERILTLERQILLKPSKDPVRPLHILSGDLTLHKRTLSPLKNLVYGLRRYDSDRCAALNAYLPEGTPKVTHYMSHQARVYLADVYDHTEYVVESLEMYANIADNLVDYCFNNLSHETNEVMRRMTLMMIIFLPLTLLTGYFGMNFDPMPAVNNHSDMLFWKIALPVMLVLLPLFLMRDIKIMWHSARKRMAVEKFEKDHVAAATPAPVPLQKTESVTQHQARR